MASNLDLGRCSFSTCGTLPLFIHHHPRRAAAAAARAPWHTSSHHSHGGNGRKGSTNRDRGNKDHPHLLLRSVRRCRTKLVEQLVGRRRW